MKTWKTILSLVIGAVLLLQGSFLFADEPSVSALVGDLKSTDAAVRLKAIDQLGAKGAQASAAVAPLADLLKDPSTEVRMHAAVSLGHIGADAKPAVPALIDLLKDTDPGVRRHAIKAVMAIHPGPQVTVPLCVKLLEDADAGGRVRILNAITEAGPAAVPGLIEALKSDKAAYWACLVLRDLGPVGKDAVPALLERLKDPRPEVRREVVLTLAAMDQAAAAAVPQIAALLSDEHVAPAATYALGRIGKIPDDIEAKIRENTKSDNKMLRASSLWAVGNLHPTDTAIRTNVTEQLIGMLKDEDPYVRVAAARALSSLPSAPDITLPIWEKSFKDADETTMHYALDAMAKMGAPVVPKLIAALKHEKLRAPIAQVLAQIGPPAAPATEALSKLIDDMDEDVARAAAMALASIGPAAKAAVPALTKTLVQPDASNSHAVAYALGSIGPDAATAESALTDLLTNPDQDLAVICAWSLIKVKPSPEATAKALPVLTSGLGSGEPAIRRSAAEMLGTLGPLAKDAVPALEKASKDGDKSVSDAASKALTTISKS